MGNLNITYLRRIIAYASACQRMLSVSIAFMTYEGLTCNVRVTYAERNTMSSVLGASTKFIDFMASGRFIRDLSNEPSVSSKKKVHIKYDHECKILIVIKVIEKQ